MLNSRRIAELEQQVATLTQERDQARTQNEQLTTQVTSLTAERDQARTDLTAAQSRVTELETANGQLTGQVTTLTSERDTARNHLQTANAGRDEEIERQVTERCAAAGVAPIKRETNAGDPKDPDKPNPGAKGLEAARERLNARHRELHGQN